jgi:two-component system, OmpR family, sensor histidine kinase MprB
MSLRMRIAAAAGLAVAIAVVVVAAVVYLGVRGQLRGEVDDSLRDRAEQVVRFAEGHQRGAPPGFFRPGDGPPPGAVPGEVPLRAEPAPFGGTVSFVQFVAPDGGVRRVAGAGRSLPVGDEAERIASEGEGSELTDLDVDGNHLRVLTTGLPGGGAIQVARPLEEVDSQLESIAIVLALVGVGGILLSAALGAAVASAALAPVARFTRRTEELTADPDLSHRIEVVGDDELARLARSFNATLDSLEGSVEAQRQLVADASHELRTPIASLRANIQTLQHAGRLSSVEQEALRRDVIDELDELTALVADVVELARGTKLGDHVGELRLDEIVCSVVERARGRATNLDFRLDTEATIVRGDPQRIQRAVSNLVDNAAKWSPAGGAVEVELADGVLSVRDHGPGFDDEDLPRVFERFYRADGARALPGSGLGLAIVRQATEAHGGGVSAANAPGGGALLRASFGPDRSAS